MISATKIRDNFSRIAHSYEQYADIQYSLAESLLQELKQEKIYPDKILDIGCGTGKFLADLSRNFSRAQVIGLDISQEMVSITKTRCPHCLVASAQALPFKSESFDLLISNAVYQWVENLDAAFKEAYRVIKNNGIFVFNCFGKRTLKELRDCFKIEENGLPAKDIVYAQLLNAGFAHITIEENAQNKYFDNLRHLLWWLKKIGGNCFYAKTRLLSPGKLEALNYIYAKRYGHMAMVYATFEVIKVSAKKTDG